MQGEGNRCSFQGRSCLWANRPHRAGSSAAFPSPSPAPVSNLEKSGRYGLTTVQVSQPPRLYAQRVEESACVDTPTRQAETTGPRARPRASPRGRKRKATARPRSTSSKARAIEREFEGDPELRYDAWSDTLTCEHRKRGASSSEQGQISWPDKAKSRPWFMTTPRGGGLIPRHAQRTRGGVEPPGQTDVAGRAKPVDADVSAAHLVSGRTVEQLIKSRRFGAPRD
jgi:hypothetical protein